VEGAVKMTPAMYLQGKMVYQLIANGSSTTLNKIDTVTSGRAVGWSVMHALKPVASASLLSLSYLVQQLLKNTTPMMIVLWMMTIILKDRNNDQFLLSTACRPMRYSSLQKDLKVLM
jgi:hypothetical protein